MGGAVVPQMKEAQQAKVWGVIGGLALRFIELGLGCHRPEGALGFVIKLSKYEPVPIVIMISVCFPLQKNYRLPFKTRGTSYSAQ